MLIDTHCHINMIVKKEFDRPLTQQEIEQSTAIVTQAQQADVSYIINVGTNIIESKNCIAIAQRNKNVYASIGIHPNDYTATWKQDLKQLKQLLSQPKHKIVAIGECGLDFHYPDYNKQEQQDVFKAQIEVALEHKLPLIVHTRQAPEETLRVLEEFKGQAKGTIHCFSEDLPFAQQVIEWGYVIGIGGTITYPKNDTLRQVVATVPLSSIVLETDAPFLPPQFMRGKQNHPKYIANIAQYLAELRNESLEAIAQQTTTNAQVLFNIVI